MQYMVIEKFYPEKLRMLYNRFDEKGRMLPEGLYFFPWSVSPPTVMELSVFCPRIGLRKKV